MINKPIRIVLDTNVFISAILFGGKPRLVLSLALTYKFIAVTSPVLIVELQDILIKKFSFPSEVMQIVKKAIENQFIIVQPKKMLKILKDDPDNRVLEAAIEGECKYIITGDKELLKLGKYKKIKILTPDIFLSNPVST